MNTTAKERPPRTSHAAPRIFSMRLLVSGIVRHLLVSLTIRIYGFGDTD